MAAVLQLIATVLVDLIAVEVAQSAVLVVAVGCAAGSGDHCNSLITEAVVIICTFVTVLDVTVSCSCSFTSGHTRVPLSQ